MLSSLLAQMTLTTDLIHNIRESYFLSLTVTLMLADPLSLSNHERP